MAAKTKIVPAKHRMKLIMASVVAIAAIYTYIAYSRNLFPFTLGLKNKVNSILKGGEPEPAPIDEEEEVERLGGGGGYDVPGTLSNLDLTDLYNLMFYNQRRLEGDYESDEDMLQGGDIPEDEYEDEEYEDEEEYEEGGGSGSGRPIFDPSKIGRRRSRRRWRIGGHRERRDELPPDIPEDLPDDTLAEIGDLRDLRDRLLAEIDALEDDLQEQVDDLRDKLAEEKEKREDLEEVVEEIKEEIADDEPPEERKKEWIKVIAVAQAGHDGVKAEIKQIVTEVKSTQSTIIAATSQVKAIASKIEAVAVTGKVTAKAGSGGGSSSSSSKSSSGTKATAGGGKAVACAGGKCISAGMALRRGYLSRGERQYAFSKLQHKARRMNTLKARPTSFLKNKQFMNVLPPVVKRRHMASRVTIS